MNQNKLIIAGVLIVAVIASYIFYVKHLEMKELESKAREKEISEFISLKRNINDYARVIKSSNKGVISSIIEEIRYTTGSVIKILTVKSLGKYSMEEFLNALSKKSGFNDQDKVEGIMVILIQDENKLIVKGGYTYNEEYLKKVNIEKIVKKIQNNFLAYQDYNRGFEILTAELASLIAKRNGMEVSENILASLPDRKSRTSSKSGMLGGIMKGFGNFEIITMLGFIAPLILSLLFGGARFGARRYHGYYDGYGHSGHGGMGYGGFGHY